MKIDMNNLYEYNKDIYKLKKINQKPNKNNNLIIITSINPTSFGEGKTTTLIGLVDLFNKYKYNASGCLRQPSIGPYFGLKGGATGGGKCSLKNDDFINLGLTGDFDKIATVNNLIMSIIENEIFHNLKDINQDSILWRRCVDLNDRSLRKISYKLNNKLFNTSYTITAASDIMALFSLCKNTDDFINKLDDAIICKTIDGKDVKIKDLNISNSIRKVISNALIPNVVKTQYDNTIYMHGGPFANIAHGTSSLISIKESISNSDYTFVECGFGSDLGLEKFINIVSREGKLNPKLAIYTISFESLKYHGDNDHNQMIDFLLKHLNIAKHFNLNCLVLLNRYENYNDVDEFIEKAKEFNIDIIKSNLYSGTFSQNKKIIDCILSKLENNELNFTYDLNETVLNKIEKISKNIYCSKKIIYSKKAKNIINNINNLDYYICVVKDSKQILPNNNILNIDDIHINHSARLIVPIQSSVMLMPGLPKKPNAKN